MVWRLLSLFALALTVIISFQNCNSSPSTSEAPSVAASSEEPIAKPLLDCKMKTPQGTFIRRIHSLDSGNISLNPLAEGQEVVLDCSDTKLSDGNSVDFQFNLQNYGKTESNRTGVFTLKYDHYGSYPVTISVQDLSASSAAATALPTVMNFEVNVRCASNSTPIDVSSAQITVTPTSKEGYFNYALSGITGGVGKIRVGWDFNGDDRADFQMISGQWQFWSLPTTERSSRSENVYTLFGGLRPVKVFVSDECQRIQTFAQSKDFALPWLTGPAVRTPDYTYYLQAKISPVSGPQNLSTDVSFRARYPADSPDRGQHVKCDYRRNQQSNIANFSLDGTHLYGPSNLSGLRHGISLAVSGFSDNGSVGQVFSGNANLSSLRYDIPDSVLGTPKLSYSADPSSCNLQLRVERVVTTTMCTGPDGTPVQRKDLRLLGEYECLRATGNPLSTSIIKFETGRFYCEAGDVEHCSGGSGGADTGLPPPGGF